MDWYIVVKTINGRRYLYRQKTWREGKHVRTRSEYIGPAGAGSVVSNHPDTSGAETLSIPFKRPINVDAGMAVVLGKPAIEPVIPWKSSRRGDILVELNPQVEEVLKNLDVKWTRQQKGAWYNPNTDVVNIPPLRCFEDRPNETATQAYYSVVFHELVHWTLDFYRTDRDHYEYAREELVAELGAMLLMQHFGIEIGDESRHARYFQGWHKRCRSWDSALDQAKKDAAEAVRFIVERGIISK